MTLDQTNWAEEDAKLERMVKIQTEADKIRASRAYKDEFFGPKLMDFIDAEKIDLGEMIEVLKKIYLNVEEWLSVRKTFTSDIVREATETYALLAELQEYQKANKVSLSNAIVKFMIDGKKTEPEMANLLSKNEFISFQDCVLLSKMFQNPNIQKVALEKIQKMAGNSNFIEYDDQPRGGKRTGGTDENRNWKN